ncbi:MAG TPA: tRNA lysidine(34) synthetase TilS, partial [Longimicrobiales bacterium]|nr:tRNA lysidine(34) synthetase TilS [Longimicrobiales bacterium]
DSMVLLHQLRFAAGRSRDVVVAHLDHGMRRGSAADASWLRGVCRAWELPLAAERLSRAPGSEKEARDLRYRFLEEIRARHGATAVVTAHHADDQAETVLFRILRGTGVRGLRGMEPARDLIVRPLLDRWRSELEEVARSHGVPHREDPTNRDPAFARNALRHVILPAAEARVAPGSRAALVRLAENAARAQEELTALESVLFRGWIRHGFPGRVEIPSEPLQELPRPVRRRLLRAAADHLGVTLSRDATDTAVRGMVELYPGQGLDLTGGLRLERGLDGWILLHPEWNRPASEGSSFIRVEEIGPGEARLRAGRTEYQVMWGPERPPDEGWIALDAAAALPVTFRGWNAGDRIRLPYGSKAVAKLLLEAGVSRVDRPSAAVCLDPRGEVLWVPGIARTHHISGPDAAPPRPGALYLTCHRLANA